MPLVKLQEFPTSPWREVFAQSDGTLSSYPYHLHSCSDWSISDPSPDEIRRIPPESWLGQFLYAAHGIDPSTSFLAQAHSGLTSRLAKPLPKSLKKNDTESKETADPTIPVVTTQL